MPVWTLLKPKAARMAAAMGTLLLVACDLGPAVEELPSAPEDVGLAVDYLTAGVALSLTEEGRIPNILRDPTPRSISAEKAVALATAALRVFGPHFQGTLEQESRQSLNVTALVPVGKPLVANTPYAPANPAAPVHERNLFASHYIVNFGEGGRPLVSVSVSTEAWDVEVSPDGKVDFPMEHGNEFRIIGIHPDGRWGSPLAAEEAVLAVVKALPDVHVKEIPLLVGPNADWIPHYANWRVTLDRPVSVQAADGRSLTTAVVYVGGDRQLKIPAAEPQSERRLEAPDLLSDLHTALVAISPLHP